MESIIGLQVTLIQHGHILFYDTIENESLVHRARNVSVGRFMQKTDSEYFMFVDADIHFDPMAVIQLLNGNHDVAVACYPKKFIHWEQAQTFLKQGDQRDLGLLSSSLVVNFGAANMKVENDFIHVLDGPTGFMLIKRDVFKRMQDHYPDLLCVNDHMNRDFDNYHALFDCMIDPDNRRYLSEDYAFCRRWQQMGGKIHAHIRITLGHVGNLPFQGRMSDRLKDASPQKNNEDNKSCSDTKPGSNGEDSPQSVAT
jgi:hypothetical protein